MTNFEGFCFTCGGQQDAKYKDIPCPECGKKFKQTSITKDRTEEEKVGIANLANKVLIPKEYQGLEWSKEVLMRDHKDKINKYTFQALLEQMEKIQSIFASGLVPNKSVILVAPPTFSKVTWTYSCMQLALGYNHTVAPLLDTREVKRLLIISSENPRYKLDNGMTYEQYINCSVLFMTVTKTEYVGESFRVVQELIDARSRRGLPTYIISRFSLKEMSFRDYHNHFESIKDFQGNKNPLKYPVILEYSEKIY